MTLRRSGNWRETALLLVPTQLDGNMEEKAQVFKRHLDLVLGNLLHCLIGGLDQMPSRGFDNWVLLLVTLSL